MKLGTLKNDTRDGALCVVARDLKVATVAYDVAPTLQAALDDWDFCAPRLEALYREAGAGAQGRAGSRSTRRSSPRRSRAPTSGWTPRRT